MKTSAKSPLLAALRRAFAQAQQPESADPAPADRMALDRRAFLRHSAQTGMLLGLGGLLGTPDWDLLLPAYGKYRVAIVGAGISGLTAGYYLRKKGIRARIFEADKRPGGRIKSAKIFGGGTLVTEIGAEFLDSGHTEMFRLAHQLMLDAPLLDTELDKMGEHDTFYVGERAYTLREVLAELKNALPTIRKDQNAIGDELNTLKARAFDKMSIAEYLEGLPLSCWMKQLLNGAFLGENGLDTDDQSALNFISTFSVEPNVFMPYGDSDERYKIIGGNEQVPQGLAERLAGQIQYGHRLLAVKQKAGGHLQLSFDTDGPVLEESYDAVIMAIPFNILRSVNLDLPLSPLKRRCIDELGFGNNTKFILEFSDRVWRRHKQRGYLFGEPIPNGWDSTHQQTNNAGVGTYTVYLGGNAAKEAVRGSEETLKSRYLPVLDAIYPGMKTAATGKYELAYWPGNPNVKGSYSCYRPGQFTDFYGKVDQPAGNLYFAGEHCSVDYWGFMEGGARAGRAAAERLLRKIYR